MRRKVIVAAKRANRSRGEGPLFVYRNGDMLTMFSLLHGKVSHSAEFRAFKDYVPDDASNEEISKLCTNYNLPRESEVVNRESASYCNGSVVYVEED